MIRGIPTTIRFFALSLAALVVFLLAPRDASADEVRFPGTSASCFGAGCVPGGDGQAQSALIFRPTFNGSILDETKPNGFLAIGRPPRESGPFLSNANDLSVIARGTISLSGTTTSARQTPEPATLLLLGAGLLTLGAGLRKRHRASRK